MVAFQLAKLEALNPVKEDRMEERSEADGNEDQDKESSGF
jgi:hypothetical protein